MAKWIKGHSKIEGNEIADTSAKEALFFPNKDKEFILLQHQQLFYFLSNNTKIDKIKIEKRKLERLN